MQSNHDNINKTQLIALIQEIVSSIIKNMDVNDVNELQNIDQDDSHEELKIEKLANELWKDSSGTHSRKWKVAKVGRGKSGEILYQLDKPQDSKISKYIINRDGRWYYSDTSPNETRQWRELEEDMGGMSVTANVSPVTGKNSFKKRSINESDITIKSSKPSTVYPIDFKNVRNYIRIKRKPATDEIMVAWYVDGKFNDDLTYYTTDLKDAYDTFVSMQKHVDDVNSRESISEMTTTSAIQGYNVPGAFSRKGGSESGVKASAGYTLTPIGKKDMELNADKLV